MATKLRWNLSADAGEAAALKALAGECGPISVEYELAALSPSVAQEPSASF